MVNNWKFFQRPLEHSRLLVLGIMSTIVSIVFHETMKRLLGLSVRLCEEGAEKSAKYVSWDEEIISGLSWLGV